MVRCISHILYVECKEMKNLLLRIFINKSFGLLFVVLGPYYFCDLTGQSNSAVVRYKQLEDFFRIDV